MSVLLCFSADGNGRFDPSAGNDFVWSLSMPDEVNGPAGPLIAGDPQACIAGDGTYFQAPFDPSDCVAVPFGSYA